jgi:Family of unknown function (DUF6084)
MPELTFAVDGAAPVPFAAAPTIAFRLRIANAERDEHIQNVLLTCQIQIETPRRRYTPEEQRRLVDLFGEPSRWSQTLRTMLWTHASATVPPFDGDTQVELLVPCTFDFNVAATKYFYGLDAGEVPVDLLFSGTIFFAGADDQLQMTRIPWTKEARYRLPVAVWKEMMDLYYPNHAWLCLERDAFERLYDYKRRRGLPTWERTIEELLSVESPSSTGRRSPEVVAARTEELTS